MSRVFVDTWFYLAALNRADPYHARALAVSHAERRHRVTTDWVIVEVGDAPAARETATFSADSINGSTSIPGQRSCQHTAAPC